MSGMVVVRETTAVNHGLVVTPSHSNGIAADASDALSAWNKLQPGAHPFRRQAQNQLEILTTCQAPVIPGQSHWPVLRPRQLSAVEHGSAGTAFAQSLNSG